MRFNVLSQLNEEWRKQFEREVQEGWGVCGLQKLRRATASELVVRDRDIEMLQREYDWPWDIQICHDLLDVLIEAMHFTA